MQESHRPYSDFEFEIVDSVTPLVILYGARGSGKTMSSLIPFSTGDFYQKEDGRLAYIQVSDIYPKLLCKAIIKAIRHALR